MRNKKTSHPEKTKNPLIRKKYDLINTMKKHVIPHSMQKN